MGLNILSLIGNLIALYILARVAMYMFNSFESPGTSMNVVDMLMKFNIDATGLFAPKSVDDNSV